MSEPRPVLSKMHYRGTHRALDPDETLERIKPLLGMFGITRVADITGLDSIGLPVAVAIRPGSRSNITFQGKGLERSSAKVSAIMESIETYCAERINGPLLWASVVEMRKVGRNVVDIENLTFRQGARFSMETRILWFEGRQLIGGESCWLPFECVHTNFTLPAPAGSGHFVASTNGLASGNDKREAIVHALCELIERDAQVLFSLDPARLDSRRLNVASIDEPDAVSILAGIDSKGFVVAVWDLTSDIGIAVFKCHIMERQGGPGLMPLPAEGHGCHPDKGIALLRAILEAIQSRATIIAGTRDDIGPSLYERFDDMEEIERWRKRLSSNTAARPYSDIPHTFHKTVDEDIDHIQQQLRAVGIGEIVVTDLSPGSSAPVAVVRVVVPGLEGLLARDVALGKRARKTMEEAL